MRNELKNSMQPSPSGIKDKLSPQSRAFKAYVRLPLISGVLIILSQPPLSLFPLAYIALMPLMFSLKRDKARHNFICGFIAGLVSYLGLVYWVVIAMNRYGGIDIFSSFLIMLLLALYLSLYVAVFTVSVPYLEERLSIPIFISAPIIWVTLEYLRGIVLTGFPWSLLAYTQQRFLPFIQVSSIIGPYFISFLIVAINCIVYHILVGKIRSTEIRRLSDLKPLGPPFLIYCIVILIFSIASLIYGYDRLTMKEEGNLRAAIIQGNIPRTLNGMNRSK